MSSRDYDEHRIEASVEDARWLMSPRGGSLTFDQAAARLGLTPTALEKRIDRASKPVAC